MDSFTCSTCLFATKRLDNLKRHLKNVHGVARNTVVPIKSIYDTSQLGDGLPRRQAKPEPEDGLYTKEEYEETMST